MGKHSSGATRLREMIELPIEKLRAKEQQVLELASGKGKWFTADDSAIVKSINQEEFVTSAADTPHAGAR